MAEYTKLASSDSPAHIIYVLDASGTMGSKLGEKTRAEWLSEALTHALDTMIERSFDDEIYRPRYKISMITYSNTVDDSLTGGKFEDVKDFWEEGIPEFSPAGKTFTSGALDRAYTILKELLQDPKVMNDCPAPLLCHVTDGEYNVGGDPRPIAKKIKELRNKDGAVLFQNLFITDNLLVSPINDVFSWTGFMPDDTKKCFKGDKKNYALALSEMSSSLPESYASVLADHNFNLLPGSQMMYPGQNFDLIKLAFVTSMSTPFIKG